MEWNAEAEGDALEAGTVVRVDRGYADSVPQNGSAIAVALGASGRTERLTVVSAAADRLEVTDGRRNLTLKPHAARKPNAIDADGRAREAWIVA